jgi:hypothetical protein
MSKPTVTSAGHSQMFTDHMMGFEIFPSCDTAVIGAEIFQISVIIGPPGFPDKNKKQLKASSIDNKNL